MERRIAEGIPRLRVVLVYNPLAGKGRASRWARLLSEALGADGDECVAVDVGPEGDGSRLEAELQDARALVAIGGDGTVQAHAPIAARTGVPIYQFPLGTENLFAREFGMNRRYATLRATLDRGETLRVDLARCNGDPFLLMCSVGPDANIVHRLASQRTGPISHTSYARHVLGELLRPAFKTLHINADGEQVISGRAGLVVVANSRQYALRIDPAKDASMTDGALDLVFFPVSTRIGLIKWLMLSRLRRQRSFSGSLYMRAHTVSIRDAGTPVPFQLDGEAMRTRQQGGAALCAEEIRLEIEPGVVPVLVPAK
ncbi:MAG: hypothetical protein EA380_04180 [Phycisphaeraceae bacterium]|nr:MAG: hypothetical protein EA380_04180 [Phycisphaeraceae bacterium]